MYSYSDTTLSTLPGQVAKGSHMHAKTPTETNIGLA